MKNKTILLASIGISFFVMVSMTSCKKGLDEKQKVFLDYAKLEDVYGSTGFYRNLDLYNTYAEPVVYRDSAFSIADFKAQLKKSFRLISRGNEVSADFRDLDLQYPHQYVFKLQEDGSVNIKFSVFVPDTFYKFSVDKSDIGKTMTKDSAEVTLLDITNDGATLMVVNKGSRHSYDYTYDGVDKKDFGEKEEYVEPKEPGYNRDLFISERIETPNRGQTSDKDSLVRTNFARLNMSVVDETGRTLVSDGRINDFRHYLWYRSNDMPYLELTGDYYAIRQKYKEMDQDSLHKFNPIHIINLKASGKVARVEFFLRSNKGHVETIDLGNLVPQPQVATPTVDQQDVITPITNVSKEELPKLLKINVTTIAVKRNEPDYLMVYAALPVGYNNKNMSLQFSDIRLVGEQRDTVAITEIDDADEHFNVGFSDRQQNLRAIKFPLTLQSAKKIIGKIEVSLPNYYDKTYNINNLPKGITIAADGTTLTIDRNEPAFEELVAIYAFEKQAGIKPLATFRPERYDYSSSNVINKYVKKVNTVVIRSKKESGSLNEQIPFEIAVPQKEKMEQ